MQLLLLEHVLVDLGLLASLPQLLSQFRLVAARGGCLGTQILNPSTGGLEVLQPLSQLSSLLC